MNNFIFLFENHAQTFNMRIGYDAKRAFQNKTGLGNYSRYIISLINEYIPQNKYFLFAPKATEINKLDYEVIVPTSNSIKFLWRSWGIKKDLHSAKIDVYHGLSNEIPFGLNNSGIKTVVTIHDLIFLRFPKWYKPIDRFIYNLKFKYAAKNADKIIAISEQTKRDIEFFYKIPSEKITVIYQNCHPRFGIKPSLDYNVLTKYAIQKKYIVCVGTIEPRKNQINLAKAFEKLALPDVDLVFIGRGKTYKQELEAVSESIANIKILDNISNEELVALYQNAHFAVYISLFEGFGIPVLEALRAGIPVLAATGSCLEEAGGNAALYVEPTNVEEISINLKLMLNDESLYTNLKENINKHLEKFEDEKIAKQLNQLYVKLKQ